MGEFAHGLNAEFGIKTALLGDRGSKSGVAGRDLGHTLGFGHENHPGRSAGVLLAIDVVEVFVRIGFDALVGDLDQVGAAAKGQGVHGAGFHTAGQLTLFEAVVAERALLDQRIEGLVVFEARHVEGAGDHAVTAADTLLAVIRHGTVGVLRVAFGEAGAGACRVVAVEALLLAEEELVVAHVPAVDDGPLVGSHAAVLVRDGQVREGHIGFLEIVDFVAAFFALAAADAAGHVVQHAVAVVIVREGMAGFGHLCGAESRSHSCCSHKGQEFSAIHIALPYLSRDLWQPVQSVFSGRATFMPVWHPMHCR